MQIALHLGAHCTDEEALLRCLLRNRDALAADGTSVPGPNRYRTLLRDAAAEIAGGVITAEAEAALLDQIVEDDGASRVVLSFDSFMAFPRWAIGKNQLYPRATERTTGLVGLFPSQEVEFHLAIRNPATFLPALFEKQKGKSYEEFIEGSDPMLLRWSDLIARLRAASPQVPVTVWCDEDTPLIWPEVLCSVAAHEPWRSLDGVHAVVEQIMAPEGFARMTAYLAERPPQTEVQRRRIVAAFLDKYAIPERIDMPVDLPGWTEDYVGQLSALYDEDVEQIAAMQGVTFIAP
jgi:hypothetical protein